MFSHSYVEMADPVAAISGLNPKNDDKTLPVWFNSYINDIYSGLARNYRPRELNRAAADWKTAYDTFYPQSRANQVGEFYSDRTKEIINDPNTYLSDYGTLRDENIEAANKAYGDMFSRIVGYNLDVRGARDGFGGKGNFADTSSYGKALLGSMAAGGATGLYSNIFNNLGREAAASYGSREDHNRYLLDLFAQDPFGLYARQAANSSIAGYLTKLGLTDTAVGALGNLVGAPGIRGNLSGYKTVKGTTSRLSDIGKDINSALTMGLYGQSYGSQPGQDTATTMGLIGTAASMYGGSNQYQAPQLANNYNAGSGGSWQQTYSNYNPNVYQTNPNAYMGSGMSGLQQLENSGAQDAYYRSMLGGI